MAGGRVAVDFCALVRRRRGSISVPRLRDDRGATQPKAKSGATRRTKALRGVWAALLAPLRPMRGMLVARALPATTNCFCAVPLLFMRWLLIKRAGRALPSL